MRESIRRLTASDADQTRALGARLADALTAANVPGPLLIGLSGTLGAGKTTFVAGLLRRLGHEEPVRSPTYTLVEPYRLAMRDIYHCDLYRLRHPDELEDLGLPDLVAGRNWLLIEWPDRAGGRLGEFDLDLHFEYSGEGRQLAVAAGTPAGRSVLENLRLDPS